jgi:hypothetical protein
VKAVLAGEPSFDPGMFVLGVIVAMMWISFRSDGGISFLQEGQPFIGAVPLCRVCAGTLPRR